MPERRTAESEPVEEVRRVKHDGRTLCYWITRLPQNLLSVESTVERKLALEGFLSAFFSSKRQNEEWMRWKKTRTPRIIVLRKSGWQPEQTDTPELMSACENTTTIRVTVKNNSN